MDYNEAFERLWNHANMPTRGREAEDSFIYAAWQTQQTRSPRDFQPLYDDVLTCLSFINTSLNGPVPSQRVDDSSRQIDSALCYCVSGILVSGWRHYLRWQRNQLFDAGFIDRFASMLVRIGIAWDQVLAGDIDDIIADAEREFTLDQT